MVEHVLLGEPSMHFISRRRFVKTCAWVGAGSLLASEGLLSSLADRVAWAHAAKGVRISVVRSKDYFQSTIACVDKLGGMGQFVSAQSKVGLLVNSPFRNPATHASPEVVLAVIQMCYDAGAKEIHYLKEPFSGYWTRSRLARQYEDEIRSLKSCSQDYVDVEIPRAVSLKRAKVIRELLECDVLINIPITKDHEGCRITGALKNMMGAAPHSTCRFFHMGTGKSGWYGDLDHLNQCIADLNLLRKPDLIVSDATEFVATNGPFGPGEVKKAQTVLAASDPVAIDTYSCRFLGVHPADAGMIGKAAGHGLGQMDLRRVDVTEIVL